MKRNTKVSTAVIRRLPRYYRQLSELQEAGVVRISSSALGKSMGLTASQIRQDLFCFGGFGQQGYGYKVDSLKEEIGEILGISRGHTLVVLGTGNLGRALIKNFKFGSNGFHLLAAFDVNEQVVGTKIAGVPVYHTASLEAFLKEDFIMPMPGHDGEVRYILDKLSRWPHILFSACSDYAIINMVTEGLGVSILPELLLQNYGHTAVALPMDPPQERVLGMGVPQLKTASPVTRNFMRYVEEYVRENTAPEK